MDGPKHIPVLFEEVLEGLCLSEGKSVVDATLGGGGHTRAIWQRIAPTGKLLALDQDEEAVHRFLSRAIDDAELTRALKGEHIIVKHANFAALKEVLEETDLCKVDALMADLGYSSDQIEDGTRGLSFQQNGPLDMRLDTSTSLTAREIVNTYEVKELARVFRVYGEEEYAESLARAIVTAREGKPLETTEDLRNIIESATPKGKLETAKIHPATKVFQALRIVVNKEYEVLSSFLEASVEALRPGGRIAVISFHSGEDRLVKEFFQEQAKGCVCPREFPVCICGQQPTLKIITKKVITAGEAELRENPRARSAKLRVAERL